MLRLTVDKSGMGDFTEAAPAIEAVKAGEPAVIYIKNGIYEEKLLIAKPNITLVGQDKEKTVLRYNDGALKQDEKGEPIGTFKTASVHVTPEGEGFRAYNLTFENNAGLGSVAGQAVALYLDCDRAVVSNCRIIAKQDTLLTGPMFLDIEENPDILHRQLFDKCYIEGDVDFIFGGAAAYFKSCKIFALERAKELPCYITAACTSQKLKYGYVFEDCTVAGSADEGRVFLGRPWREYANTVFINCRLDKCISKKAFSRWNGTDRHLNARYGLYGCYGEGSSRTEAEDWVHILTAEQAEEYTQDKVFGDWKPDTVMRI